MELVELSIKRGVSLAMLQPQMLVALFVTWIVCCEYGVPCVITSGADGEHSSALSRHYIGFALDFRNRTIPQRRKKEMADKIQTRLGKEFYVKLEATHVHIQYNGSQR